MVTEPLAPVLQDYRPRAGTPWRFERIFWTIPLGLVCVALLVWEEGRRYSLSRARRLQLVAAFALAAGLTILLASAAVEDRIAAALIWERPFALALYLGAKAATRIPDRGYHYFAGGDHAYGPFLRPALPWIAVAVAAETAMIVLALLGVGR